MLISLTAAAFSLGAQSELLDINTIVIGTVNDIKGSSLGILRDSNHSLVRISVNQNSEYTNALHLADIRKGDRVQVRYRVQGTMNVAINIKKIGSGEV